MKNIFSVTLLKIVARYALLQSTLMRVKVVAKQKIEIGLGRNIYIYFSFCSIAIKRNMHKVYSHMTFYGFVCGWGDSRLKRKEPDGQLQIIANCMQLPDCVILHKQHLINIPFVIWFIKLYRLLIGFIITVYINNSNVFYYTRNTYLI